MTRKFLEDMGLDKEQIDKILDANSQDIGKAKGDGEKAVTELAQKTKELESLKNQVSERDKQLEELKNSTGDVEAMKEQIANLQAENKASQEAHAKEVKQLKLDSAIDAALTASKAKNNLAVRALLKDIDKMELDSDGAVKGLKEQLEALGKSDSYLFDIAATSQPKVKGAKVGASDGASQGVDTSKMTYSELASYMAANPDAQI